MQRPSGLWILAGALALYAFSRTQRGRAVMSELTGALAKRAELFRPLFDEATRRWQLPPGLLLAQGIAESALDPHARSAAGAVGIMQIVPRWHPELGEAGALDPARAIPYAAQFLRQLHNQFGSWTLALAAYNAGPATVRKYGGVPPYKETRDYVARILQRAGISEPGVRYA